MIRVDKEKIPKLILDLGLIYPKETSKEKRRYGIFECMFCGKHFKAQVSDVKSGNVSSCGCWKISKARKDNTTHNMTKTRIYRIWNGIKQRCLNVKSKYYKNYGGRGITICNEWKQDFMFFYNWAMSNNYSAELEIDRIDNDGNYEPNNCRWVTTIINQHNKRVIQKNNTSGYRGVCFDKRTKKWKSGVKYNGKHNFLGYFDTPKEAGLIYDKFIIENKLTLKINGVA